MRHLNLVPEHSVIVIESFFFLFFLYSQALREYYLGRWGFFFSQKKKMGKIDLPKGMGAARTHPTPRPTGQG
jgi:hypothetical protein